MQQPQAVKRQCLTAVLRLFLAAIVLPPIGFAQSPTQPIDGSATTFEQVDGTPMFEDAFYAALKDGQTFSMRKDSKTHKTTMRLEAKGEKKDDNSTALKIKPGEPMPAIDLPDQHLTFGADHHYSLVSFFYTDCPPCIGEIPQLNAFAQSHRGVNLVSITFDGGDDLRAFVTNHSLRGNVIADAQPYLDRVGATVFPTLALVAPDGKFLAARIGAFDTANGEQIDTWVAETMARAFSKDSD